MGVVEWSALGAAITILISMGGVVVRLVTALNRTDAKATAASAQAAVTAARILLLESAVVEHRVQVAKEYVSKDTLASLETRIVEAINRVGDRLDKFLTNHQS